MERTDTRPPFAASGGIIPPELRKIKTPCYVLDEAALIKNAELMGNIAKRTGCKMLLAQKAFSNYDCYHLLEPYLTGTEASGLYEARLGAQEMPGKEVHVFCAGYREDEFEELLSFADHIVFNSPSASSLWKKSEGDREKCRASDQSGMLYPGGTCYL